MPGSPRATGGCPIGANLGICSALVVAREELSQTAAFRLRLDSGNRIGFPAVTASKCVIWR